jgi:hypothetical protein
MKRKLSNRERQEIQIRTYANISRSRDVVHRCLCGYFDFEKLISGTSLYEDGGRRTERASGSE